MFDQIKFNDEEVLIVVESDYVDQALAYIERYIKLGGVEVQKLNHCVYFDLENDLAPEL